MDFNHEYNQIKNFVEESLIKGIQNIQDSQHSTIFQSMRYSLEAGGKRFRPVVHLATVKLLGGNIEDYIESACAIEFIHTYSLIHDDLPAMDNDDYRRGKKTNHLVYGEGMAILAGDGLLNTAYEMLFQKMSANPNHAYIEGAYLIARCAGINGMIAGQVADIESEGKQIDEKTLLYIHDKKTAALIEASIVSAAIMMNASKDQIASLKKYSNYIGLAFQISDDILDVEGNFDDLGKSTGSDLNNEKNTFVSMYGLKRAKEELQNTVHSAIESLSVFDKERSRFFIELAYFVASRRK